MILKNKSEVFLIQSLQKNFMPDNNICHTKYYFCLDDSSTSLILMTHFVSTIRSIFFVCLLTWWFIDMVFTIIKPPTRVRIKAYFYCVDLNTALMQIFNLHNVSNYGSRNIGKNIKMFRIYMLISNYWYF